MDPDNRDREVKYIEDILNDPEPKMWFFKSFLKGILGILKTK